jgi:4a-hydroxytetrahydrobiopterin dehydratase
VATENIKILDQIRILQIPLNRQIKNIKYSVKAGSQKRMERKIMDGNDLAAAVAGLNGWAANGQVLRKRYKFDNFAQSLDLVNRVGALAEAADHHPDITFGWGYAEIALTTHDRGGITDVDIALASQIDKIGQ